MIDLAGRRLVVVHNPHSSRTKQVQAKVLERLTEAGYSYTTLEVKQAPLADNVKWLAPQLKANDLVLSAAGDGSTHAVANAILAAKQADIALGFLAYGNFNDLPQAYNRRRSRHDPLRLIKNGQLKKLTPIAVKANNKFVRYTLTYATIGWTALAAAQFNDRRARRAAVQEGKVGLVRSLWRLWRHYLKTRQNSQLEIFSWQGKKQIGVSDILLVNGPAVARIFKTGTNYGYKNNFLVRTLKVRRLLPNLPFIIAGLTGRMGGQLTKGFQISFSKPARVPLQCDGEYVRLEGIKDLEVVKSSNHLNIITDR